MKKFTKVVSYTVILIIVVIVSGISYITLALPNVGPLENIKIELTASRIARGDYLANRLVLCMDCHSQHDGSDAFGPVSAGKLGSGGKIFDVADGFPGSVPVPNITPYNLENWTDGELYRAITTGERKDGSAIFPLMPWPYYSKMSREDIYAIIAYLRTIKPVKSDYPKSKLDFPLNILVHTMPAKASPGQLPPQSDTVNYGAYVINAAACMECHSQQKQGKAIAGLEYAGGREFKVKGKRVYSANITPDRTTGIGNWSREAFVQRFRSFSDSAKAAHQSPAPYSTVMPWYNYSSMKDVDLKAIYAYLQTLKPVHNKVIN